jgi:hypothetical protein
MIIRCHQDTQVKALAEFAVPSNRQDDLAVSQARHLARVNHVARLAIQKAANEF